MRSIGTAAGRSLPAPCCVRCSSGRQRLFWLRLVLSGVCLQKTYPPFLATGLLPTSSLSWPFSASSLVPYLATALVLGSPRSAPATPILSVSKMKRFRPFRHYSSAPTTQGQSLVGLTELKAP